MSTHSVSSKGRILRFGIFEVDLGAGELRKNGTRVRLQEQPFQLLALLLERPNEIVTREELRNRLWAADTFVDFDHSLNTAIKKIREALGDSAVNPRFVETIARRGYRFLAQVEVVSEADLLKSDVLSSPAVLPPPVHADLEIPLPNRGLVRSLFMLIQIMYLSFYVTALVRWESIEGAASPFSGAAGSQGIFVIVTVTAAIGIPLRFYLFSATAFDFQRLGKKFLQIFLLLFALDQLWALSPLLLTEKIGFGAAFAATAALLYVPFAERTLVRLAYPLAHPKIDS